jgi:hypothetical protein
MMEREPSSFCEPRGTVWSRENKGLCVLMRSPRLLLDQSSMAHFGAPKGVLAVRWAEPRVTRRGARCRGCARRPLGAAAPAIGVCTTKRHISRTICGFSEKFPCFLGCFFVLVYF